MHAGRDTASGGAGCPGNGKALGSLVVRSKGDISFCSDGLAQLAGYSPDELVGESIRHVIPSLRLRPETEGYNVALGIFSSARRCLQSWQLKKRDGTVERVDGYFGMLKMDTGYLFCLELHQSDADAEVVTHSDATAEQCMD